jgi:predicted small lipoprotein YifL
MSLLRVVVVAIVVVLAGCGVLDGDELPPDVELPPLPTSTTVPP